MAATATPYDALWKYLLAGDINLTDDDIYVALLGSGYTPSAAHAVLADVIAQEITGTGYDSGGAALSGKAFPLASGVATFAADNLTWSSLTATFRFAVLYAAVTRHSIVNPLIGYVLLDATPADITVTGIDYSIVWSDSGILTLQATA